MQIYLLFGTETGNAEMLCDDLQEQLEADHDIDIANLEEVEPEDLDTSRFHIFVCSTYGEGELPQSAIPLTPQNQIFPICALPCLVLAILPMMKPLPMAARF